MLWVRGLLDESKRTKMAALSAKIAKRIAVTAGGGTELTQELDEAVPLSKIGTDLLGSWWPCQCVLPILTS